MMRGIARAWEGGHDALTLALSKPIDCEYANLRDAASIDPARLLAADTIAQEWPGVQAALRGSIERAPGIGIPKGVNPGDGRAIYTVVRSLAPVSVLEIGTHMGASTVLIAAAMLRNGEAGAPPERLVTVDIRDVNDAEDAPWRQKRGVRSPREAVDAAGGGSWTRFVTSDSRHFLRASNATFDFVFVDGSHKAAVVYQELQQVQRRLRPGGVILLHDYFPGGRRLWPSSPPLLGPWRAVQRLQREGAPVRVLPLSALPWPTKASSRATSLALLLRSDKAFGARIETLLSWTTTAAIASVGWA